MRRLCPPDAAERADRMISALLGGIGLFVLGMSMMAEGLRAAAGGALRDVLARYTGGPLRAFASGAALTAVIQSSSATTVMTIGLVSAGLLGFAQSIGVIFGAALGTTSTAWLVAFLGLRYSVSILALPLVGIGAFLHLLGRGRGASIGFVLAGFGLIFVGIDTLQAGMLALSERVDLAGLPAATMAGRLALIALGIGMTVVMQSSSAAVATTLAAVYAGTIDVAQAAALVIGQNMGTTVTAGIASIGASVPARRTALAHVVFNTFSGVLALLALPLYLRLMGWVQESLGLAQAEQIAIFHTAFNAVGVAVLLPFAPRYAALITSLVRDRRPALTRFLDASIRSVPTIAVEAVRRTVVEAAVVVVQVARDSLARGSIGRGDRDALRTAGLALAEARVFLAGVRTSPEIESDYNRHLSVLHAIDHVERLTEALEGRPEAGWHGGDPVLGETARDAVRGIAPGLDWLIGGGAELPPPDLEPGSKAIAERRRVYRTEVMARTAAGALAPGDSLRALDTMRWIDRVVYHVWRATHHLAIAGGGIDAPGPTTQKFEDPPEPGEIWNDDSARRETG